MLLLISLIVAGTALLAFAGYQWFRRPFYHVGHVRDGKCGALTPPEGAQHTEDTWVVDADVQVHHFTSGTGKRPALVVHGGPGRPFRQPWTGLKGLEDEFTFHYYDQRGCGASTRPFDRFDDATHGGGYFGKMKALEGKLGVGAQVADIERIRVILGEEKLVLVGHSWGAFLCTLYAMEFPKRVEKLVLVNPATMLEFPPKQGDDLFKAVEKRLPKARHGEFSAFLKEYMDFGSLFNKSEQELIALQDRFTPFFEEAIGQTLGVPGQTSELIGGWMVYAQFISMGMVHDYRGTANVVDAPALVVHGDEDLQTEAASRAYDVLPGFVFVTLAGTTHAPFEERPEAFGEEVARFLR